MPSDQTTPGGLRHLAILYLAAHYRLRSSELVRLTLDDIAWRASVLKITQSKTKHILLLPLTDEAGQMLSSSLKSGRPPSPRRQLFLRRRAPAGALAPTAVPDILDHRIALRGLELPSMGGHGLRPSLAVHLLRSGICLPTIAAALGHGDLESTTVYVPLATEDLRQVGLPVPKGGRASLLHRTGWKEKLVPGHRSPKVPLRHKGCRSPLAPSRRCYLKTRRALGRAYRVEEDTLHRWDDFLRRHYGKARRVKPQMFLRRVKTMLPLQATVGRKRMRIVPNFLLFYARRHPKTPIPELLTFAQPSPRQPPYLVPPADMARILATANVLPSAHQNPLPAQTIRLALVLLYGCGLRRGELLRLRLGHFDPQQKVLGVENTKFHKSRLIPLSNSVAEEVHRYVALRQHQRPAPAPEAFLVWRRNPLARASSYSANALADNWRRLCLARGVLDERGRPPRLHDLRHSLAVTALHRCYRPGREVQSKLVHLPTYLGPVFAVSTHYYLHLSPELRQAANRLVQE